MQDFFPRCLGLVLAFEGGLSDHPEDKGGLTKFGISRARYPHLDIANLTLEKASELYRLDFWLMFQCHKLPRPLGLLLFDSVVQFSPVNPIRWLQTVIGAEVDGRLGPKTINLANSPSLDLRKAVIEFMFLRGEYRQARSNYSVFGKGWRRRDITLTFEAALHI